MKKSSLRRTTAFCTALLLSALTAFPALAAVSDNNMENGIGPGYEETVPDNSGRPASPLDAKESKEVPKKKATIVRVDEEKETAEAVPAAGPTIEVETGTPGDSLGTFRISGYCGCERCCGDNTYTYSGVLPKANHTLSADLNQFPIGTKLWIGGIVYTVEDMGSGIDGNRLDIYFDTHEEALDYGLQDVEVFAVLTEN